MKFVAGQGKYLFWRTIMKTISPLLLKVDPHKLNKIKNVSPAAKLNLYSQILSHSIQEFVMTMPPRGILNIKWKKRP